MLPNYQIGLAFVPEFLALKHESIILGHSSNPACGLFCDGTCYDLCCLARGELAWLFLEPDTGLVAPLSENYTLVL